MYLYMYIHIHINITMYIYIYTYEGRILFGNKLAPLGFWGGLQQHFSTFRFIESLTAYSDPR